MRGSIVQLPVGGRACEVYLPDGYDCADGRYPAAYLNGCISLEEIAQALEDTRGGEPGLLLVNVPVRSWNDECAPWQAPALTPGDPPFGGRAAEQLRFLSESVKGEVDLRFRTLPGPENTALLGYSLAGLAALYALYTTECFGNIGCLSGSLWYDGWTEYMKRSCPLRPDARVYLSLGSGEERSRNRRLATVGDCTREAARILKTQLLSPKYSTLEWNRGGHGHDVRSRYAKAFAWLGKGLGRSPDSGR